MIATVDARNGTIRVGLGEPDGDRVQWKARFCVGEDPYRSAEEFALTLRGLSLQFGVEPSSATRVLLSSVVPAMTPLLHSACSLAFGAGPGAGLGTDGEQASVGVLPGSPVPQRPGCRDLVLVVGPGVRTGLKIRTDTPSEVGSDLVCDAVAAYARVGGACVVVDFETILTFTAVNGQGELLGVAIAPGPSAAAESLRQNGAQLPQVRLEVPRRAIGKNSTQSIQSGIFLGYRGLVDGLVSRFREEIGENAAVVGTGNDIGLSLAPEGGYAFFDPWLSLEGLAALERRNR